MTQVIAILDAVDAKNGQKFSGTHIAEFRLSRIDRHLVPPSGAEGRWSQ
ncbi:hypothetical protein ACONUD_13640 [Microbulbifer harenosus]|nr:hypothetical protein [Microbulbifer harenosus]